jgi:hypothetical protein
MAPTLIAMALIVFLPLVQAFVWTLTDIDRSNMGTRFKEASWTFTGFARQRLLPLHPGSAAGGHPQPEAARPDGLPPHAAGALGHPHLHLGHRLVVHLQR